MSHVAAIQLQIHDIEALKAACAELGLTFMENKRTYEWFGQFMNDYSGEDAAYLHGMKPEDYGKCVHAIKVPGAQYEIGVINHPSGKGFGLIYDFYGSGGQPIVKKLGKGCEKLKQIYGVAKTIRLAKSRGMSVTRTNTAKGIKLTVNA